MGISKEAKLDPNSPEWELARSQLVAALVSIGAKDKRNGFTNLANAVAAGEAVSIPSYVALEEIAKSFRRKA